MASAHQLSCGPDWTNTGEVPAFAHDPKSAFLLDVKNFLRFRRVSRADWLCIDNFESIAAPSLARPLHICDAFWILVLHREPGGLLWSYPQIYRHSILSARSSRCLLHGALVTFVRLYLQFGSWENEWINCAMKCLNGFCWRMRGRKSCWKVVWPRPLEIRLSSLEDPLVNHSVNGWSHSGKHVENALRCVELEDLCYTRQLESASGSQSVGLVFDCLHAWDHQKYVVVCVTLDGSPILNEIWRLTWMPFVRITVFFEQINLLKYRWCSSRWIWTNMSKSQTYTVASSVVWVVSLAPQSLKNPSTFESFLVLLESNHFYSSYDVRAPESTMDSLFRRSFRKWRNIARKTWFEEPIPILRIRTWNIAHAFVQLPSWCPCHFFHAQRPLDGSFPACWRVRTSLTLTSGLDDSKCKSHPFLRTYLFARWRSHTRYWVLSSEKKFRIYICRSSFDGMWVAIDAELSFSSAGFAVCLYAHSSPNLHTPGSYEFCTFGNMPII